LPMLIIVAWLRRPAPKALAAGLPSIAADLPPFALRTSVGSRYTFRDAVGSGFGSFLGVFREGPRWRKSLDCCEKAKVSILLFREEVVVRSHKCGTSWMNPMTEA
jgi:hypothetical protein